MRFITLNKNNRIIGIRFGEKIVEGEIQSDIGELGQIMKENGTFIDVTNEKVEPQPTLEDKVNYLYYKSKGLI